MVNHSLTLRQIHVEFVKLTTYSPQQCVKSHRSGKPLAAMSLKATFCWNYTEFTAPTQLLASWVYWKLMPAPPTTRLLRTPRVSHRRTERPRWNGYELGSDLRSRLNGAEDVRRGLLEIRKRAVGFQRKPSLGWRMRISRKLHNDGFGRDSGSTFGLFLELLLVMVMFRWGIADVPRQKRTICLCYDDMI